MFSTWDQASAWFKPYIFTGVLPSPPPHRQFAWKSEIAWMNKKQNMLCSFGLVGQKTRRLDHGRHIIFNMMKWEYYYYMRVLFSCMRIKCRCESSVDGDGADADDIRHFSQLNSVLHLQQIVSYTFIHFGNNYKLQTAIV